MRHGQNRNRTGNIACADSAPAALDLNACRFCRLRGESKTAGPFEDDMAPLRSDAIAGLRSIFEDAPAEVEALAAHSVRGVADELHFTTLFSAERAAYLRRFDRLEARACGGLGLARALDLFGELHAGVADENFGSCNQLVHLLGQQLAEGKRHLRTDRSLAPHAGPPGPAGRLHDLLDALMADAECLGHLA